MSAVLKIVGGVLLVVLAVATVVCMFCMFVAAIWLHDDRWGSTGLVLLLANLLTVPLGVFGLDKIDQGRIELGNAKAASLRKRVDR